MWLLGDWLVGCVAVCGTFFAEYVGCLVGLWLVLRHYDVILFVFGLVGLCSAVLLLVYLCSCLRMFCVCCCRLCFAVWY